MAEKNGVLCVSVLGMTDNLTVFRLCFEPELDDDDKPVYMTREAMNFIERSWQQGYSVKSKIVEIDKHVYQRFG